MTTRSGNRDARRAGLEKVRRSRPRVLLPAFAIMVAGAGVSLIISGATLVYKRIQIVNDGVLMLVTIYGASALPLIHAPGWRSAASHAFPSPTASAASTTSCSATGPSRPVGMGRRRLVPLLTVSAAYLLAGIGAFILGERVAKRRGPLGRY